MTIFSYAIPFLSDLLSAYRCRCAFMPFQLARNFSFCAKDRMPYYASRPFVPFTAFQFNTLPSYNFGGYSSIFSNIPSFNFNLNSPQLYQPRILSFDFGNVWGNMGLDITPIKNLLRHTIQVKVLDIQLTMLNMEEMGNLLKN